MSSLDLLRSKIFENRNSLRAHLDQIPGKKTVFTNGCFDILHRGHVEYLNQARDLGDLLIVALNSDASTTRLKGPGRPVNSEKDRALVLASLSCVDYVTFFDEATPVETLEILRPDIHTKGGDYRISDLPEKNTIESYGGKIVILPFVAGKSTTGIIEKMKSGGDHG